MRNPKICRTYSKIFFEKARSVNALPDILSDLKLLRDAFDANKKVAKFFCAKICSFEEKMNIIRKHKMHKLSTQFIEVLIKYDQMDYLSDIYEELMTMKISSEGMTRATLFSPNDMSQKEIEICQSYLEESLKQKFCIEHKVDASLIGGIILQFGSMMYDASVRNAVQKLKML